MLVARKLSSGATLIALCSLGAIPAGCLKRTETIRVHEDGSMNVAILIEGDADDVTEGDPLLTASSPWTVTEERRIKDEGKVEIQRSAERTFKPGEAIPTTYAGPADTLADQAARFETSLVVEKRGDLTYYHFKRVYQARPWARFDYERQRIAEDEVDPLGERSPAELTPAELEQLARALVEMERHKWIALTDAASDELGDLLSQDQRLAIRRAVVTVFDEIPTANVACLLTSDDQSLAAEEAIRIQEKCRRAIREAISEGSTPSTKTRYDEIIEKLQHHLNITEDIGDDGWEVEVSMPGTIVEHNGTAGDNEDITWEFVGTALRDRDVILMATSCVKASKSSTTRP